MTILRGTLEDHLGNQLHPKTEAHQVELGGKMVDAIIAELQAKNEALEIRDAELLKEIKKYLPLSGGTVSGEFGVDNTKGINVGAWGQVSAGSDGHVLIGQNCYKHKQDNTFRFANNHSNMGAKGVVLQLGVPGVYFFDTGSRATTAGEEFSPVLHSLVTSQGATINGLSVTGNGANNISLIGDDHVYLQFFRNGVSGGRSGYIGFAGVAEKDITISNSVPGGNVKITAENGFYINGHQVPRTIRSTNAPTNNDGVDGDVWHQYV